MPPSIIELTADIVASHASGTSMTGDVLITELNRVFATLKQLESGAAVSTATADAPAAPTMTIRKAFKDDQISCMVCGKTGFKTLTRHLKKAHDLKPGQYRKQFNIPSSRSLTAKNYSDARRNSAIAGNLAANLEKARAVRAAKNAAPVVATYAEPIEPLKSPKPGKAAKPIKSTKSATEDRPVVKAIAKPAKPANTMKTITKPTKAAKSTTKPVKQVKTAVKTPKAPKAPKS